MGGADLTPKAAGAATVSKSQDVEPDAGQCLALCVQSFRTVPSSTLLLYHFRGGVHAMTCKRIFISTQFRLHLSVSAIMPRWRPNRYATRSTTLRNDDGRMRIMNRSRLFRSPCQALCPYPSNIQRQPWRAGSARHAWSAANAPGQQMQGDLKMLLV